MANSFYKKKIRFSLRAEVTISTAVLSNCHHFTAKYTQKKYFTLIYTPKM